jgi:quercetin dioxygenase-like cupin family protein
MATLGDVTMRGEDEGGGHGEQALGTVRLGGGHRGARRVELNDGEIRLNDVMVKRLEEFENNHGIYFRARAGLGVTAFGLSVESWPAAYQDYPEHDESESGQEEVYVILEGSCRLLAASEEYALKQGVFARVGPGTKRKIIPGPDGVKVLCIGGVPGGVYRAPAWTENGAPWR